MPRADTLFRVQTLDHEGRCSALMYAQDVSLGGLYVTSRRARWPGQLVQIRFTLPGQDRAVRATCRVVGLDEAPEGCGLSLVFLRLSTEARLALHRYIDRRPVVAADDSLSMRVQSWVERITEDCSELLALSRA
ncbi:MAG: PilZ domain-containing protein [Myxococcota bacterium]